MSQEVCHKTRDYLTFYTALRRMDCIPGVSKMYAKLFKLNLKLITLITNMLLFLNSIQSDLNFEPSFVGIHQVLKEIWLFEHEFQARNFGQLLILRVLNLSTNCSENY